MNNKTSYIEYLRTAVITIVAIMLISTIMLFVARYNAINHVSDEDKAIQEEMFGYLMLKYQHEEEKNPTDATVNLKLAQLYEMFGSYKQAEEQYLIALDKRDGKFDAVSYGLAGVLLLEKKYNLAEKVISSQRNSLRYSSLYEKGKFYKSYGDSLFNDGDYNKALGCYDKAIEYLKKINSSLQAEVQQSKCDAYIVLADKAVANNKSDDAIGYLELNSKLCKSPMLSYRLGLLYIAKEPEKAVEVFDRLFKTEPYIINFDIYKRLLTNLRDNYIKAGDALKANLYDAKLSRVNSFTQRNVLSMKEIDFTHFDLLIKKFPVRNEYDLIYNFDVENITDKDIPVLYAVVEFYDKKDNKIYSAEQKISPLAGGFKAGSDAEKIKIIIKTKKNLIQKYDTISLKLYLSKNPKISKKLYATNKLDVTKGKKLQVELF